ncbi:MULTISPECIES: hypothetical protein [unclassified Nocardia]|uniref:hypothetical protein n=1 Tax=unclassified Nocardia TaxID=2637762 RepID=UPI00278BAE52|nr:MULTISPECIES: hypothetical protein [unclassified Nocardia]
MPPPDDPSKSRSTEPPWAEPDTLHGMIQRGRGACYPEALANRARASEYVIACIVRDPRWDHQVEERAWLYAALIADLGIDLTRCRPAYTSPSDPHGDSDAWLATDVLALLARRGVDGAVTELRHYLRTGRDLDQALARLLPFAEHSEADGLLDDVLAVADDERLAAALGPFGPFDDLSAPPWPNWCRANTRVGEVIALAECTRTAHRTPAPDRAARDRQRLLAAAVDRKLIDPTAARDLTEERWENTLLTLSADLLDSTDTSAADRIALCRSLRTLRSPRTLTWARTHAGLRTPVQRTALSLFAERAEPADAPHLLELLTTAASPDTHIYTQHDLVTALGRLHHSPAAPTIEELFDNTVYSYLRTRCATELSHLTREFPVSRATECLYDCESRTRAIGIAHADLSLPEVRDRLAHIGHDPTEDDDNRRAAAARINR